jgi:hypothetical protein
MTTLTLCLQPKSSRFCKEYRASIGAAFRVKAWFAPPERLRIQPTSLVSVGLVRLAEIRATFPRVSLTSVGLCSEEFGIFGLRQRIYRASLWSRICDIQILLLETWFASTDWFETQRIRQPRRAAIARMNPSARMTIEQAKRWWEFIGSAMIEPGGDRGQDGPVQECL